VEYTPCNWTGPPFPLRRLVSINKTTKTLQVPATCRACSFVSPYLLLLARAVWERGRLLVAKECCGNF